MTVEDPTIGDDVPYFLVEFPTISEDCPTAADKVDPQNKDNLKSKNTSCCGCLKSTCETLFPKQHPITVQSITVTPKTTELDLTKLDIPPDSTSAEHVDNSSKTKTSEENICRPLKSTCHFCFPRENVKSSASPPFNCQLLCIPSFTMYCISSILFQFSNRAAYTFIPPLAEEKLGQDLNPAVMLSITGGAETVGRIVVGLLLTLNTFHSYRRSSFVAFIFILSVMALSIPYVKEFYQLAILFGIYGLFSGAYVAQKSVILADIMGTDDIASSFGILVFFQSIGVLVGVPVSGAVSDAHGRDTVFKLGGGVMMAAGFFMIASIIAVEQQSDQHSNIHQWCTQILHSVGVNKSRTKPQVIASHHVSVDDG